MSTNSTIAGMTFSRLRDRGERCEPRVGHLDDADVRLDRAERIVLRRDAGLGQRVEERGLADVGQADDAALEAHGPHVAACHSPCPGEQFASRTPGDAHEASFVCTTIIARSMSPAAMSGHTPSARSIAASIASRSAVSGGFST